MAKCLVVQHMAPEGAFAVDDALVNVGVGLDLRQVFAGDPIPVDASGADALVVMGGSMSAASDAGFPTRRSELALLADALSRGIPTLGICLGAQLLAAAAGAAVYPGGSGPEVGWGPIVLSETCHEDALFAGLPTDLTVLHWHGDTFDLPKGAVHLAGNDRYANQAFRLGNAAWGLQFHLEVTQPAVEGFIDAFADEADAAAGGANSIRSAAERALAELAPTRNALCSRFAALVLNQVTDGALVDLG
jgi:GMP synthase-like glutamine amidotransferase